VGVGTTENVQSQKLSQLFINLKFCRIKKYIKICDSVKSLSYAKKKFAVRVKFMMIIGIINSKLIRLAGAYYSSLYAEVELCFLNH